MKHTLSLIFALCCNFIFGQLSSDVDTIYKPETTSFSEVISEITIFNNTSDSLITWTRIQENIPASWFSAACDEDLCYFPETATGTTAIAPGDSANFRTYFYPENTEGIGEVSFSFKTESNPEDSIVVNFIGSTSSDGSSVSFDALGVYNTQLVESSIFYPTISENGIFTTDEKIKSIKLLNEKGVELLNNESLNLSSLNLSGYAKGVYFLIIDNTKTQRIFIK